MLEIHGKMLTELRRTTDQLEKVRRFRSVADHRPDLDMFRRWRTEPLWLSLETRAIPSWSRWVGSSLSPNGNFHLVEMPLPLRSPPCTVERPSLPDINLPPPTESDENIMDQILPDSSRADNNYALEELTQAVLAGNELQRQMLEIHGKMSCVVEIQICGESQT
jgi:hypothetical protein